MILLTNPVTNLVTLYRCGCSHKFYFEVEKYLDCLEKIEVNDELKRCVKCHRYPWRIAGMNEIELSRRQL